MTSTTPPKAIVLSGVDQEQLQREFARTFSQPVPDWDELEKELVMCGFTEEGAKSFVSIEKEIYRA